MVIGKVEHIEDNIYKLHLSSDVPTKPIAGHRFVDLLGKNQYINEDDLLLDLYGLKFVPKNVYMELGNTLEDFVIGYRYPDKEIERFKYDDYRERKSGAFNQDDEDIGGLPDGLDVENETLIEVKCTTSKFKGYKEEWLLQAQFYSYWYNKRMEKEGSDFRLKQVELLKYYVPKDLIDAHLKYPNFIIGKNLKHDFFELDTEEIERLIEKARKKKKELIDKSYILIDLDGNNSSLFFQLKKAMNSKKLQIDYDKNNEDEKRFYFKLRSTKVGKKKRKKNTKGKVKI